MNLEGIETLYHDCCNQTDQVTTVRLRIENVPPDEFLISREAKGIQEARFVCHRVKKTVSELRVDVS